jgi:hypothetical protein
MEGKDDSSPYDEKGKASRPTETPCDRERRVLCEKAPLRKLLRA